MALVGATPWGRPKTASTVGEIKFEPGPAAIGFSIDAPSEVFAWLEKPGRLLPHLRSAEVRGSKALPISSKRRENFSKTTREALLTGFAARHPSFPEFLPATRTDR